MAIHVTDDEIRGWEARIRQIDEESAALQKERDLLSKKLAAVPLFQANSDGKMQEGVVPDSVTVVTVPRADNGIGSLSLPEAVRSLLEPKPYHYTKLALRKALIEHGVPESKLGTRYNYYYTVLGRMEGNGELAWDRRGRLTLRRRDDAQPHLIG
jgi:hypothetical protein